MSAPEPAMPRLARYVITRGWIHVTLLCGAGVFLLPFVWMLGTSVKTDEELTSGRWMPSIPRFVAQSPYVLPPPLPDKPLAVPQEQWDAALPMLLEVTRAAFSRLEDPDPRQLDSAASALLNRTAARIRTELWSGDASALRSAYLDQLDDATISSALNESLARLELRGLLLQTLDGQIIPLCTEESAGAFWRIVSGPARLNETRGGLAYLQYDFTDERRGIVLEGRFDVDPDPAQWHKLNLSLTADGSWHRITAEIVTPTGVWRSTMPVYLSQRRMMTAILQFPSYEDQTLKPRSWIPLQRDASAGSGGESIIRITIHPSSTPRAIWGKLQANYVRAFRSVPFWTYLLNSLALVTLTTVGTLFSSMFVAYAFARLHWPGRAVAFVILLSTMMLPGQVTMIPSFMIWRQLGWYNTLSPMWLPAFFGGAFFIFLMTQHMKTIPRELEEAARIDGLGPLRTWWYIFVPLCKPAAAAVAIMTIMASWNEFLGPLVYLRDQSKFPLSLGLFAMQTEGADWTMIMAGNVIMTLPMIIMFILFQRYFIQGMMMGSVKG